MWHFIDRKSFSLLQCDLIFLLESNSDHLCSSESLGIGSGFQLAVSHGVAFPQFTGESGSLQLSFPVWLRSICSHSLSERRKGTCLLD